MRLSATVILIFLLSSFTSLSAQTNNIIRGIVTLQNSNSQPAKNVRLTTFGSNTAYTNSAGQFELRISDGKPGQTVRLIVQKDSFQVLGPDPLIFETAIREDPNEMIRIALANIQVFQERISRFMQSIDKQIQAQSGILKDLQETQEKMAELEAERKLIQDSIALLFNQVQTLEASKDELARKLASIDLDQASSFTIQAVEKFLAGDVEEALAMLNDDKLERFYEEVLQREKEVAQAKAQAIENYMVRARMQQTLLQFDEAAASYRAAIEKDSTNLWNLAEYGSFLSSINLENEAISLYIRALGQTQEPLQRLELLSAIGMIHVLQNQITQADSVLNEAFRLSQAIEMPNAVPLLNLMNSAGYLHQTNGDFTGAERYYLDALALCEPLFSKEPALYYNSWTALNANLSLLYLQTEQYEKSEPLTYRVIEAFSQTPGNRTTGEFLAYGYFLNNLGQACTQIGEFTTADSTLLAAETICKLLEENGVPAALPLHALVLNNLGLNQYNAGNAEQAIPLLERSLEMSLSLSERNPLRFQSQLAIATRNLALASFQTGQTEAAGRYFLQSRGFYETLASLNPEAYLFPLVSLLEDYLYLVRETGTEEEVVRLLQETATLAKELDEIFPGEYDWKIARLEGDLAWQYLLGGNSGEAIRYAREGLETDGGQSWIYSVLAPSYMLAGEFPKAKAIYAEWKNKPYSLDESRTFREVFLEDIDTLQQGGVWHKDFEKIRKILKK